MAKRILIIDDEPEVVAYLKDLFESYGYLTSTAKDGVEGMEVAKREKPDLISLDIDMPERDGTMFYVKFRKDPDLRDIPVIVISGVGPRPPSLKEGVLTLQKPIDPEKTMNVIAQMIGK